MLGVAGTQMSGPCPPHSAGEDTHEAAFPWELDWSYKARDDLSPSRPLSTPRQSGPRFLEAAGFKEGEHGTCQPSSQGLCLEAPRMSPLPCSISVSYVRRPASVQAEGSRLPSSWEEQGRMCSFHYLVRLFLKG